jgi:hypothetical protein
MPLILEEPDLERALAAQGILAKTFQLDALAARLDELTQDTG